MKREDRAERVLALHYEGWSVSEIAELEGIGLQYAIQILLGLGISTASKSTPLRSAKAERNKAICLAYQTENVSTRDLAKRFGVTFERIAQILRKDNLIEMRVERNKLAKAEVVDAIAAEKMAVRKRLRAAATVVLEGFSIAEASRQTGVAMSVIQRHCKALGVISKHGRWQDFGPRRDRVRALHAEGKTFTAIVDQMRAEGEPINYQWIWRNCPELRPAAGRRVNPRDRRVGPSLAG